MVKMEHRNMHMLLREGVEDLVGLKVARVLAVFI